MRHARPVADAADVDMDERGGVIAHSAALQPQGGSALLFERNAGNEEIDRLAGDVLAELGHPAAAPAQHGLVCGDRYEEMIWIASLAPTSRWISHRMSNSSRAICVC